MTDIKRTTIPIDAETYEVFKRMADTAGMSVGRCIGEWLADTVDSALFVTQKMQEARQAPALVMREMQAMAKGLQMEVDGVARSVRQKRRNGSGAAGQPEAARGDDVGSEL